MKKIGLFYGGTTAKTAVVALKIQEAFAENEVVLIPIEGATRKEFESFDNFVDGIGILAEAFTKSNAELIGFMPVNDYHFTQSRAVKEGHFLGLPLDIENQSEQTEERILKWVAKLKKEFQ